MSDLTYNTDIGYGIRIVAQQAEAFRPSGWAVQIHFYDRAESVKYAARLIQTAFEGCREHSSQSVFQG